jgi:predicted metal-dependent enzyme (double-stranded beta helix superfamily)
MGTHNHRTGWTLYGVYENEIEVTNYQRIDEGTDKNRAHFKVSQRQIIPKGQVIILYEPDFDIHRVVNPTLKRSVTIHVWGRDPAEISRESFPRLPSTTTGADEEITGIEPLNTVYDNCKEAYEPVPGGYLKVKKEFQMT